MRFNTVVIGAGSAGIAAIQAAREVSGDRSILLIHNERNTPYRRDLLTRTLFTGSDPELLVTEEWVSRFGVEIRSETEVVSIDRDKHLLRDGKGGVTEYDSLILALGSQPEFPSLVRHHERGSFFVLRTWEDAREIERAADDARNILIAGMGVLALELADRLVSVKKSVTLAGATRQLMPRQLNLRSAEILEEAVSKASVSLLFQEEILSFDENNLHSWNVDLLKHHGQYDMVIFCIGSTPRIDIAKDAGLKTNRGIVVNHRMETSDENIYAAGDCAEYPIGSTGRLWNRAWRQGEIAGKNVAGGGEEMDSSPFPFRTTIFGQRILSLGIPPSGNSSRMLEYENESRYYAIYYSGGGESEGIVSGGLVINDTEMEENLVSAVHAGARIQEIKGPHR